MPDASRRLLILVHGVDDCTVRQVRSLGVSRNAVRLSLLMLTALSPSAFAQPPGARPSVAELKKLSLEELMSLRVTSVSRGEERLGDAPAAVSILTGEDIRRSGAATVPEALRLIPGLHVARQTSSAWVVASRGFSSVNSEKLLVLSDTRSLYTPLFSGVFWDVQDYLLQDVERIEVIRGPGATLWGSNAVNGVVSITTKNAKATQGLYVETSAGTEEHATVAARYGGRLSDRSYYRVFGKYFDRDSTFSGGHAGTDEWRAGRAGFRVDWDASLRDVVTVQGDAYRGDVGQLTPSITIGGRQGPPGELRVGVAGGNVLARWKRTMAAGADAQLRVYYDRTHRNDPMFVDDLDTVDIDVQHRLSPIARHRLTWGAAYRLTAHTNEERVIFALDPPASRDRVISGFIQDDIQLPGSLRVALGTKLEHNDFSGAEMQPSGRIAWQPAPAHGLWGAVSRAVRVPTRLERDIAVHVADLPDRTAVRLLGNRAFGAERLIAYELGYRWTPADALSTDVAVFHNRYRGLASLEFGDPFSDSASTRTIRPIHNENLIAGSARGVEALVTYSPARRTRVSVSYSHLNLRLRSEGDDLNRSRFAAGATPRHQFGLRSSVDLPSRFQIDGLFRSLSAIRQLPTSTSGDGVPGHAELDMRLAWVGWRDAEIALVGRSLLHRRHREFGPASSAGENERAVYVKLAWGF
jgi:iron complex outermembrane recepter protein